MNRDLPCFWHFHICHLQLSKTAKNGSWNSRELNGFLSNVGRNLPKKILAIVTEIVVSLFPETNISATTRVALAGIRFRSPHAMHHLSPLNSEIIVTQKFFEKLKQWKTHRPHLEDFWSRYMTKKMSYHHELPNLDEIRREKLKRREALVSAKVTSIFNFGTRRSPDLGVL